jgi:peptide/nickel transport system permease protein
VTPGGRAGAARPSSAAAGVVLLGAIAGIGALAAWIAPGDPFAIAGAALRPPDAAHPFGTDDLGRDVFVQVLHGTWNSLQVGVVAASISAILAVAVGGVAGLHGGAVDHGLMRITEFAQALPRFFLVVTIVSLFGGNVWLIVLALGLTAWPGPARVFRAQVQATVGRDFVAAARAAGGGDARILARHVLPVTASVLVAQVSYQAGGAILAEAGLSFLGLGDPTVISWGAVLGAAQHFVREAWWMSLFPGVAVMLTVLACNLIADGLLVQNHGSEP